MTRGVVYICAADQLLAEAELSAYSVRESNPDLTIGIITDDTSEVSDVFDLSIETSLSGSFADKPGALELPFDRSLYMDTDIWVDGDLDPVFEILDQFDIAAVHNHDNYSRMAYENPDVPKTFPEYNTGIIAFKKSLNVKSFIDRWKRTYQERTNLRPGDQPSFRHTLYHSDLRVATLPPEYNCKFRYPGLAVGQIICFHGRILDVSSEGAVEQYSIEEARNTLNNQTIARSFAPNGTGGYNVIHSRTYANKIRTRYKNEGITGVVKGVLEQLSKLK
ncbi:putative nucleotide-diphospho-sugar transferase [Natronomonas marina]|uniref:putative nucleotide-diphospho-sugar transferase n=1 Tax=Natronomonas marina TaxID=2961939 RepID=UPI0020CA1B76|nr:putative nucleotide-diphospho-sugar transferase [Natronomonas marina]